MDYTLQRIESLLENIRDILCERLPERESPAQTTKVYGVWCGSGWLVNVEGMILHSPYKNAMAGLALPYISGMRPQGEAREIGADGLPVPETGEQEQP